MPKIKAIALDVDGVLTDGWLHVREHGHDDGGISEPVWVPGSVDLQDAITGVYRFLYIGRSVLLRALRPLFFR